MKRIIYTISSLQHGGPGIVLYNLIKNLDRNLFEPIIITLSDEKYPSMKESFESLGISIYCLHSRGIKTFITGAFKFRKLISQIKPDIIHAQSFRDIVLTGLLLPKCYKTCATIHCDWMIDYKLLYGKLIGTISGWLEVLALRRINYRIACSKMLAELLNNKYPYMHFGSVNNGVDTDKFHLIQDKSALRKKLGLPLDKKIIIWAGSFISRKDPLTMSEAIKQIPQDKYFFIFCGRLRKLTSECQQVFLGRKDVLFAGLVSDMAQFFQAADIYVSTSLSEGFHLTVYEAMACGLPVILTDMEVYKNLKNKEAVKFFQIKNTAQLVSIINSFENIDLKYYGQIAIDIVKVSYSAFKMAQNYQEIYGKIK